MLDTIVHAMRKSTRQALADRRALRRERARGFRVRLYRHRAALLAKVHAALRRAPATAPAIDDPNDALHARVLGILASHPQGITAQDIGNELGVDWRSVSALMRSLVGRGMADQIEQEFYLAGKASRRC